MVSNVFYCDARGNRREDSLALKMLRVFDEAGLKECIFPGDIVAIKTHLSEIYNTRYLRPIYLHLLVEKIKECGGKPFVTDTLSLGLRPHYFAKRDFEAYHHVTRMAGFTAETVGCPIIIADAPGGKRSVPVSTGSEVMETALVAPAIADADALISLAHFKGHPIAGFGGALKNLGVGGQSRGGHFYIHYYGGYQVDVTKCDGCGQCLAECIADAIRIEQGIAVIDAAKCVTCNGCLEVCPQKAISAPFTDFTLAARRIAAGAAGVIKKLGAQKCGFINLAIDISPNCDCMPWADLPIVPDIGVLASRDPVALDQATVDLITAAPALPGSAADELGLKAGEEKFLPIGEAYWREQYRNKDQTQGMRPDWPQQLAEAEALGIGSREYRLVAVEPSTASLH